MTAMRNGNADDTAQSAGLGPRLLAYCIDSVVLFGFVMVFASVGGLIVFVSSGGGEHNPSDDAFSALVVVILAAAPAWLFFTIALFWRRGQSLGQYLAGIEITRDGGGVVSAAQVVVYSLALHPLVFHPIMAGVWAYAAYQSVIYSSSLLMVTGIALGALCLLAPIASLICVLSDRGRRGLHDRIAGVRVVKLLDYA